RVPAGVARGAVDHTAGCRDGQPNHGGGEQNGGAQGPEASRFHLLLLVLGEINRCHGLAQTPELLIRHSTRQSATSCIDATSVGWPVATSRKIGAGVMTSASSLPSSPSATTETSYRSGPRVS